MSPARAHPTAWREVTLRASPHPALRSDILQYVVGRGKLQQTFRCNFSAGQRNTTEAEISAALSRKVEPKPEDSIEARQIKAMVEGMRAEARRFVSAGGAIAAYGRKLVRRQEEEIAYYNRGFGGQTLVIRFE